MWQVRLQDGTSSIFEPHVPLDKSLTLGKEETPGPKPRVERPIGPNDICPGCKSKGFSSLRKGWAPTLDKSRVRQGSSIMDDVPQGCNISGRTWVWICFIEESKMGWSSDTLFPKSQQLLSLLWSDLLFNIPLPLRVLANGSAGKEKLASAGQSVSESVSILPSSVGEKDILKIKWQNKLSLFFRKALKKFEMKKISFKDFFHSL